VEVRAIDPARAAGIDGSFDTVLCLNVLEYLDDPAAAIEALSGRLNPGGSLVVLVPQQKSLYGALDKSMGHKRRFERAEIEQALFAAGLEIERAFSLNKIGTPPWWFHSKLMGSRHINKLTLKIFDKTVWLWRRIDGLLPWTGLSLVVVARKSSLRLERRESEQLTEARAR
jgi:SAM-dependent methyltransferase